MGCAGHGHSLIILPGDHEPDGTTWPRCTSCGHRCGYAGAMPRRTRDIMRRHPWYLFTELRGRAQARRSAAL
jgi:hypothetical protein